MVLKLDLIQFTFSTMRRLIFKLVHVIGFLIFISSTFTNCREDNEIYFDCDDKLDLNKFYFLGSYNSKFVTYINENNQSVSLNSSAFITFNEDSTFILNISIPCYSPSVGPIFCNSNESVIDRKDIIIKGKWDFSQQLEYKTHTSGVLNKTTYRTRSFNGICLLKIIDSPLIIHKGETIYNDFGVHCTGINTIDGISKSIEIYLPISEDEKLRFLFSDVES